MAPYPTSIELSSLTSSTGFVINGTAESGSAVRNVGDINGDGRDDIGITSDFTDYVLFGGTVVTSSFNLANLDGTNGFSVTRNGAYLYRSIAGGDVNGDGYSDLIVSDIGSALGGQTLSGSAYVVFGHANWSATLDPATLAPGAGFRLDGYVAYGNLGYATATGDYNGDGFADIVVSAPNSNTGTTFIYYGHAGSFPTSYNMSSLTASVGTALLSPYSSDFGGMSVAAGDINGDGYSDIAVGAPNGPTPTATSGNAYVVFGHTLGAVSSFNLASVNGTNGFSIAGVSTRDRMGADVAFVGDINGDGIGDLAVGANGVDHNGVDYAGSVYFIFGHTGAWSSTIDPNSLNGSNGFRVDFPGPTFGVGIGMSGIGDFNGDGFNDALIGAYQSNRAYIIFGSASGFSSTINLGSLGSAGIELTNIQGGWTGWSVTSIGDYNGDGLDDIAVSAVQQNKIYVIYGERPQEAVLRNGNDLSQMIVGSDFGDTINGLGGNDTLSGYGGSDILDGGAGTDIARQQVASTSTVLTKVSQASNVWTLADGATTDYVLNIEAIQFTDSTITLRQARGNFNFGSTNNDAGATSDFLIYNSAGQFSTFLVQSDAVATTQYLGQADGWVGIANGVGDFNGDGRSDFLTTKAGSILNYTTNSAGNVASVNFLGYVPGWDVKGTGDFNNDGRLDILLQNGSTLAIWQMAADGSLAATINYGSTNGWDAVAVGDFNRDGRADVFLRNAATGELSEYLTNASGTGGALQQIGTLPPWTIVGSGDFNGDGGSDLLLRDTQGNVITWITAPNGGIAAGYYLGIVPGWTIAGTGDYNGDGTSDVLLQNGPNLVSWDIVNGQLAGTHLVSGTLAGWTALG